MRRPRGSSHRPGAAPLSDGLLGGGCGRGRGGGGLPPAGLGAEAREPRKVRLAGTCRPPLALGLGERPLGIHLTLELCEERPATGGR